MTRTRLFGWLAMWALAPALAAGAEAPAADELPAVLGRAADVKDPVFALLLGLLENDSYGELSLPRLEKELGHDAARSRLPYRKLRELRRERAATERPASVSVHFAGPLDMPIPYAILGYHPGSVTGSESCVFQESSREALSIPAGGPHEPEVRIENLHVLRLHSGRLLVDIDWWLDTLMGPALDDTEVAALALFRHRGRWIGMALGYNKKGLSRSGAFDFSADHIVFPFSDELRVVSRQLRAQLGLAAKASGK